MAINVGYEILFDASNTADKKADLTARVLQALRPETLSDALTTTYAAGTTSANQATLAVGGASPDYAIRVIMDSAVVTSKKAAKILARLINVVAPETFTIAHAASYTAGDRAYNHVITVT